MTRPSYTTHSFGVRPQDYLGPALLQRRRRQWQQELPDQLLHQVRFHLLDTVPADVLHPLSEPAHRERVIRQTIREWLEQNQVSLLSQGGEAVVAYLYGEVAGFGPLQPFLADPEITEIKLIDPRTVLVETAGRCMCRAVHFAGGAEEVRQLALRLAELGGRSISRRDPMGQVQMADGSRILLLPFEETPQIFVRRRAPSPFDLERLLEYGTLNQEIARYLQALARARAFFLVAGPSGSGKTAFLEMLLSLFPSSAHIVVVQQGTEIRKEGVHPLISLLEGADDPASPQSLEAVAINTLKMGVISLVVGEIKGPEAAAILHGITAGVKGGGATIHTDDPEEALRRLARLARSSRFTDLFVGATPEELRQAVARSIHVVVQLEQASGSGRRYVRQIAEVELTGEGWALRPVFIGEVHPMASAGEVCWRQVADSNTRIQNLLAAYVDPEGETASLQIEQRAEVERLLTSAAVLTRSGEWEEAEQVLKGVLALTPEERHARQLLDRVRQEREQERLCQEERAERLWVEAQQAAQRNDFGRLEWLHEEASSTHLDELATEIALLLQLAQEGALAIDELFALALEILGQDNPRAARLLEAVLDRQPNHPEAAFYLDLARSAEEGGIRWNSSS